jgi:poly(A) polymerase
VTRLSPAHHSWMTARPTRAVMRALTRDGGAARFVGGAVRNALLGEEVGDVDIATPLSPQEVMRRLEQAGLNAVPTGIDHGTVTAISSRKPFEVTTLRRDVSTDGRRATVAFTTDWSKDAARRDFTINALYAAEDGEVFDYFGGLADLKARRVRFVGDPTTRIREDYLRILRLFRFHAWYGKGDLHAEAFAAVSSEKAGLKLLSGERVQKELLRLLEATNPMPALRAMARASILAEILPGEAQLERAARLIEIEAANRRGSDSLLRLAALLPDDAKTARKLSASLKLSNNDRDRLVEAAEADRRIDSSLSPHEARKLLYRLGQQCFRDQLLLRWADTQRDPKDRGWCKLLKLVESWKRPELPIDGRDVMAKGIDEGPKIGTTLRALEHEWIEADFAPDRRALLKRLKETINQPRK